MDADSWQTLSPPEWNLARGTRKPPAHTSNCPGWAKKGPLTTVTISRAACLMAAISIAALSAAGCSSQTTGSPTTPTTTAAPPLWDACSLPDNLLNAAGLSPASKDQNAHPYSGETSCDWSGTAYGVTVIADNTMTLQYIRTKYGNRDFTDVTVAGRPGLQYHDNSDTVHSCDLALPVKTGGVVAFLIQNNAPDVPGEPCAQVRSVAAALMPALPAG